MPEHHTEQHCPKMSWHLPHHWFFCGEEVFDTNVVDLSDTEVFYCEGFGV